MKLPRRLPALACSDFRIFWLSQSVSMTGAWMQSVAQGWLVYSLTKSALLLGLVAVIISLPVLLFSLFGGVLADQLDRRKLLLFSQSAAIIPAVLLAYLSAGNQITVPWIMVLALAQGVLNAVELPVRQSYWTELLPRRYRANGNSINAVSFNVTRMLGPVLAGLIIASSGSATCFALNAASFVVGIAGLLLIRKRRHAAPTTRQNNHVGAELREGLGYLAGKRDLALIILLVAVISLFGIPFVPLLPVFADRILKVGPVGLGYLAGASGAGSVLAALGLAWYGDVKKKGRLIVAAGMLFAFGLFLFAHSEAFQASLAAMLLIGAGIVCFLACVSVHVQLACPDQLRGRVMGIYTLALIGMAPLGHSMMALLAANIGVVGALSCGSAVCGAALLLSTKPLLKIA